MQFLMMVFTAARRCGGVCAVAALSVCLGCGGSGGSPMRGEITYDGQPVDSGSISVEPADGAGPSTGGTITAGRYELIDDAAPLPGKKTVRITAAMETGRQIEAGPPAPPGTMVDEVKTFTAPPKEVEVVAGEVNEIPFHLESSP